jgi:hypothetical protein
VAKAIRNHALIKTGLNIQLGSQSKQTEDLEWHLNRLSFQPYQSMSASPRSVAGLLAAYMVGGDEAVQERW